MKASDIMTSPVVTVVPETSVTQIAALLAERRISAVPVLEEGRVVGMVSEADLLHRHEIGTDSAPPGRTGWLHIFDADSSAIDYARSHAVYARDVMTRGVSTAPAHATVGEIVALMEKRRVKRVPILQGSELVGIVSRADVVRAVAAKSRPVETGTSDDEAIRTRLAAELERQPWWRSPYAHVYVVNGVVHYYGITKSPDDQAAARVAAENVPGVRGVEDDRFTMADIPSMV